MNKYMIVSLLALGSCNQNPDSLPEELLEEVIEDISGLEFDLTDGDEEL